MRPPSRTMSASPGSKPLTWSSGLLLAALVVGFVGLLFYQPVVGIVLSVILVVSLILGHVQNDRLARLAADRSGESICTFVRSFDCRRVDTWILRAVYEELQPYCKFRRQVLPLRRSDKLEAMLGIDDEELEFLTEDIAFRAERSLDDCASNPLFGQVQTVADLVNFLMHQPSTPTASA